MTATTFADYVASVPAREQIEENILRYTQGLCEALKDNYRQSAIRGHQQYIDKNESVQYHQEKIDELRQGISPIDFIIVTGRKYYKIVFIDGGGSRSSHCFIDKKTGSVLKSASWRVPAKGERFNLLLIKDREWLYENATWCSGYLYKR